MPGVLTTTSHAARASSPPPPVASTGRPPGRSAGGWSSTSTGSTPSAASLRRFACPSTPRPHTPARAPRRSDQEIVGRIRIRDPVLADRAEQGVDGRLVGGRELRGQLVQEGGARPVGPPGREHGGGPALADLAHALE